VYLADFLEFPLPVTPYKVFANVPFGITAAVLTRLIDAPVPPTDIYAALQREAADRFAGMPDGPTETLTSALLKPWLEPTIVHRFDRRDFVPVPGVDVVLLRLSKLGPPLVAPGDRQRYRDFVTYCFGAWQPTVGDAIARALHPTAARLLASAIATTSTRATSTATAGSQSLDRTWMSKPSEVPFEDWLTLFRLLTRLLDAAAWSAFAGSEARLKAQQTRLQKVHRTRVRPPPMRHAAHALRAGR
jgi:16S rRNA A1518/A1519 N6-dimethyltransferase RsmA/KsgA/DIM1 with predicted DNA glycosylase/AP lyase activity